MGEAGGYVHLVRGLNPVDSPSGGRGHADVTFIETIDIYATNIPIIFHERYT